MKERSLEDKGLGYLRISESPRKSCLLAKIQGIDPDNILTPPQKQLHYRRTGQTYLFFANPCWEELQFGIWHKE